ncbi:SMI1 / KNR4 family [Slackia heliotrinireducens]|uniref:Putative glucan synthasis protein n=1 Tax=Slackia heliotrinireducens (strain ATCC 29202 / DSM 20476 / NCTC 11029 / RHS 1) TaxID=471855 RepID=C7N7K9_SLAHD|nr:SMI1/KNR4 family protein [Slackia heliotrinireducens]ACV22894.1 putative glucan synthasis protein [Slackia heliotrinireducens DSM 20476]VEH01682.1 SMI1 / KNR4 family [Slackia heliotrinireducens]
MNDKIKELISKYEDEGFFTRVPPTPEMVKEAQEKLGVEIPEQFLEYLNIYSYGGINGTEILGIGMTGKIMFLEETLEYRRYGLPNNLIVVENCDEWVYCLDAETGKVVSWSQLDGLKDEYPSFDDFLLDELNEAIANL